jgi:hypothetical protein
MSDRNDRSDRLARRLNDESDGPDETETDEPGDTEDTEATAEDADDAPEAEQSSSSLSAESSKPSKTVKSDMPAQTANPDRESVKDRPSVLMYLPEDLRQEMDIRFDEVNATVKRARGEGVEKNRDWYPLLVSLGLEKAAQLGDDELLTRLDDADY